MSLKTPHESTWTPILWATKLITRARIDEKIQMDPPSYNNLQNSFDKIESANRKILNYGWVNFPLAYTQVTTISVNLYFLAALFGRQYLIPKTNNGNLNSDESELFPDLLIPYSTKIPYESHTPDLFIPFFTLIELFCYVGWIKVAEMLLNPFGEDDEDFQINYLIDRNLQVNDVLKVPKYQKQFFLASIRMSH